MLRIGFVVAALALAGAPGCAKRKQSAEPFAEAADLAFLGTWTVSDSTAVWRVYRAGGEIRVEGVDSSDGERFEVTDVSFQGGVLRFTSRMPSTDWTVHNTVLYQDGQYVNLRAGASTAPATWTRAPVTDPER